MLIAEKEEVHNSEEDEETESFLAFKVRLTDEIRKKLECVDSDFIVDDGPVAKHKIPHVTIVGPRKSFGIEDWKKKIDEKIDEKPTKLTITSFNSFWDSSKLGFKGKLNGKVDIDTPHIVLFDCKKDKEGTKSVWGKYEPVFSEFEGTELDIESIAVIERNEGVIYEKKIEKKEYGNVPWNEFEKKCLYNPIAPKDSEKQKGPNIRPRWDGPTIKNPGTWNCNAEGLFTYEEKEESEWSRWGYAGYEDEGLRLGLIDVDLYKFESEEEKEEIVNALNELGTRTHRTPSGGAHLILLFYEDDLEENETGLPCLPFKLGKYIDDKINGYVLTTDCDGYKSVNDLPVKIIKPKELPEELRKDEKPVGEEVKEKEIEVKISKEIPLRNPLGLTFSQLCRKDEKLRKLADDLKPDEWAKRKKEKDLDSSRSGADYDFVKKLIFYGYMDSEIAYLLRKYRPYEKTERDDYIERTIGKAREAVDNTVRDYKNAESKRDAMVRLAEEHTEEKIIDDITGEPFVGIEGSDYTQVIPAESEEFEEWLTGEWISKGLSLPSRQTISDAAWAFSAEVKHNYDDRRELNLRVGRHGGAIYYDLGDPEWHTIKITEEGWKVIKDGPNIFQRWPHQKEQARPADEGDVEALRELTNTSSKIDDLMLEVYLATTLVPDIPHLLPIIHGPQGAAKTDLMKMMRELIDPSSLKVMSEPKSMDDAVVQLNANYMAFFDNIRGMSDRLADVLCRAVTGSGYSKRKLYTDRNQAVFNYRRCVGFNTISGVPDQPDLLDRALVIELDHIHGLDRELEETIWREFYEKRPEILAGLFDLVSEAMGKWKKIKREINENDRIKMPRMADAAAWGEAIARAKGLDKWEYLKAFNKKIGQRETFVLENNPIGKATLYLMENKEEHTESPKELLETLNAIASEHDDVDTDHKNWPSNATWVTRRLKEIEADLSKFGLEMDFGERPGSGGRVITIDKRESSVTRQNSVTSVTDFLKEESERNTSNAKIGSNTKSQASLSSGFDNGKPEKKCINCGKMTQDYVSGSDGIVCDECAENYVGDL
ncbi:hypothetical protein AKJ66_01935 [candidate division MSBL1 archaeon SCGC-AAA259E22]|uniref:DNA primase/polymerase bifunctional N-terminal domain-containing protein n=1 Tax=candidate division MSBL1 archaeon SCGC-AAA259E22 TaxID=1698265 RepID=A0A133UH63_9EURY|nr:hypothetical protein AKJ66_01935 [candidate division MSBL1 archaeon SCGC-AAA259E22]